jgi:hypothetical protein
MILVNKEYTTNIIHLDIARTAGTEADDDGNNGYAEIELTLVRMRLARLPRGLSSLYVAYVYIEPKAAVSQNAIKNDEKTTNAIATLIQQAIDNDPTPQCPLLFVCGDFNTVKCNNFVRLLGVKLLYCAPMRVK